MPTKEELERENADLRDQLAAAGPAAAARRVPGHPVDTSGNRVLSAGEVDDLVNAGVTRSPFDGKLLNAFDEGIEPGNADARRRAELAQQGKEPGTAPLDVVHPVVAGPGVEDAEPIVRPLEAEPDQTDDRF